jgi:hypothetical protein
MKKIVGIMFVFVVLASAGFAQEVPALAAPPKISTRYNPLDMLLGLDFGAGMNMSGDILNLKKGFFILNADTGINYSCYIFSWLSVGTGLYAREHMSVILENDLGESSNLSLTDIMQTPFCLTIPLAVHINAPQAEWLYVGVGLNVNIPLFSLMDTVTSETPDLKLPDTKGSTFLSLPIDIGVDFASANAPKRFIFRIMPNFLENGILVSYGIRYQTSLRIYRKR